jgi:steroid 5-alpha reductase family enzyme
MALPAVKTLLECAAFKTTVLPFVPQLYELPQQLLQSYSNLEELRSIYLATNPLISAFAFSLFLAPIFLIVSEINKNYSQVDRLWSILPTIYNAHYCLYAHLSDLPTSRLDNLIACSVVWSLRLTFNYWRKGGYSIGSEDYRWFVQNSIHATRLYA